jgi:hypothetical protein
MGSSFLNLCLLHSFGNERKESQVTSMLDSGLELTLTFRVHTSDTVREDLAAIVQKTLEDPNVTIIDVRDSTKLERIDFLFRWIATLTLADTTAALHSLTLALTAA